VIRNQQATSNITGCHILDCSPCRYLCWRTVGRKPEFRIVLIDETDASASRLSRESYRRIETCHRQPCSDCGQEINEAFVARRASSTHRRNPEDAYSFSLWLARVRGCLTKRCGQTIDAKPFKRSRNLRACFRKRPLRHNSTGQNLESVCVFAPDAWQV